MRFKGEKMLLSEEKTNKVAEKLTDVIVDKMNSKDKVNWNTQFDLMDKVLETMYKSLGLLDRKLIEEYRKSLYESLTDSQREVCLNQVSDTESIMALLLGSLTGITHFLSNHNSNLVRKGERDFGIKATFNSVYKCDDETYRFDYCRELVGIEKTLRLTRESYKLQAQAEMSE